MKLLYTLFFLLLLSLSISPNVAYANNPDDPDELELPLVETGSPEGEQDGDGDPNQPVRDPNKNGRMPGAPVMCLLSRENGIQISGIGTSLIESFEILDVYGNPVAIFVDEESFLETLFSLQGEYRLIFRLADHTLSGWIEI